jgi:hypothetical protein
LKQCPENHNHTVLIFATFDESLLSLPCRLHKSPTQLAVQDTVSGIFGSGVAAASAGVFVVLASTSIMNLWLNVSQKLSKKEYSMQTTCLVKTRTFEQATSLLIIVVH